MSAYSTVAMVKLGAQVATLRADLADAEARLAAVTALANTADARPGTCHERGLVSTRLLRAATEPTDGSK